MDRSNIAPTLVLSLNPAIDLEWQVDQVRWEEKNTILSERRWAGGKGVNVARWLQYLGGRPRLVVPTGGAAGQELERHIQQEKIPADFIPLKQATRVDVIITTADGRQMRFNPRGPTLSVREWRQARQVVEQNLTEGGQLVLSGSLPPGANSDLYARFIQKAQRTRVNTLLDCDGATFAEGIKAKPFLVKPNIHELEQWWGRSIKNQNVLYRAACALAEKTQGWVLVSRGKQGGLLVHADQKIAFWASAPEVKVKSTNGAGDAMLAAVAYRMANDNSPETWLRWGVAVGTAATQCQAGALPPMALVNQMVTEIKIRS